MSIFDPKTNFLVLGNKPMDSIIDKYQDSDQYKSYSKYLNIGLEKDIREIFIPELNKLLEDNNVSFDVNNSQIHIKKSTEFRDYINNDVTINLVNIGATDTFTRDDGTVGFRVIDKKLNSFTLLKLPYMDNSGTISRGGRKYVMINSLSLEDDITFDGNKLKFVDNSNSLVVTGALKPVIEMFNNKVTAIDLATMLYKYEYGKDKGIECSKSFIYSLRSPSLLSSIGGKEKDYKMWGAEELESSINHLVSIVNEDRAESFALEDKLEEGYLSTTTTRRFLNEILSFNNALGRTVSRDIVTSDGKTVAAEGDVITKSIIRRLNMNYIDTIHVKKSMSMAGQFIATPIFLGNKIYKGTPVIPEMVNIIPGLINYSVCPETYDIPEGDILFIEKDTSLTKELCDCLEYLGQEYIEYKENIKSKKVLKAYFEEEYINNRHFPVTDLDIDNKEDYGDYVYVNAYGDVSQERISMTGSDVSAITSLYLKLLNGQHHDLLSDPDAGLRKRVDQCSDHFHKAFISATKQFIKGSGPTFKRQTVDPAYYNNSDKMNLAFKFFTDNFWFYLHNTLKVIDMLDVTNPVSTVSSLTKINTMVKNDNSISNSMRGLSMGHYGRICPYETPQSKKLGIVNNMASGCSIEDGVMYTSYYKLIHQDGKTKIDRNPVKMSVSEEEGYRISDISSLTVDTYTDEVTAKGKVPCRVPARSSLEKTTFASIDLCDVQFISMSANQHESIACTTIPFAGGDDATRVSFGLSMVKQAKGLVNGEVPLVCTTGFLNIPNMNTHYKIFAEKDGRVDAAESSRLVVTYDGESAPETYEFDPITIASSTAIIRVLEVIKGQRITKGQTLLSSNYIKDKVMVIGVNALVAYMTDGYNYEDGVPVGRRLSDKLTSYGVHTDKFKISHSTVGVNVKDVRYEDYLNKDDKMFIKSESLGRSVEYSNTIMRSQKCRGFITQYELVRDSYNDRRVDEIKIQSVSFDELKESDKLCNRHGNKGVTCKIHENSEMPYLDNGEFIDIKYNPNGIVSRMNIGQTLEAPTGLACYVLGIKILCGSFNSPSTEDINMLMSYTVDLANSEDYEGVISRYPNLPSELHDHCRKNIRRIRHWKGTFNKEGKAYLIDPKSGKRTLSKVNIGVNYVYKLVQEGEGKLHSRGGLITSSYVEKTKAPTKGASNGGGQRMGYMELDALASYGASALLKEITNERGDNYLARNNLTVKDLHSGESKYMLDEKHGIRRSTEYMLELFKALGVHSEMTENELDLVNLNKRVHYKKNVLLNATFQGDEEEENIEEMMFDAFKRLSGGQ